MARWKWGFTGQMDIQPNWAHEGSSTIFGGVTGRGEGWQTTWLCYFLLSNLLPSRFYLAIQSHQSGHLWPPLKGWPLLLGPASETRYPRTWALISDMWVAGPTVPFLLFKQQEMAVSHSKQQAPQYANLLWIMALSDAMSFLCLSLHFPTCKTEAIWYPSQNCGKN